MRTEKKMFIFLILALNSLMLLAGCQLPTTSTNKSTNTAPMKFECTYKGGIGGVIVHKPDIGAIPRGHSGKISVVFENTGENPAKDFECKIIPPFGFTNGPITCSFNEIPPEKRKIVKINYFVNRTFPLDKFTYIVEYNYSYVTEIKSTFCVGYPDNYLKASNEFSNIKERICSPSETPHFCYKTSPVIPTGMKITPESYGEEIMINLSGSNGVEIEDYMHKINSIEVTLNLGGRKIFTYKTGEKNDIFNCDESKLEYYTGEKPYIECYIDFDNLTAKYPQLKNYLAYGIYGELYVKINYKYHQIKRFAIPIT